MGTVSNARNTTPESYITQFKESIADVQKNVLKTNADLQWFLRVERKERRWHLHFLIGDQHVTKRTKTPLAIVLFCSRILPRWPVKANSEIREYQQEMPQRGRWEEYICKADQEDEWETHTRWSRALKKEILRIQRESTKNKK